jgi:hypothetical protein
MKRSLLLFYVFCLPVSADQVSFVERGAYSSGAAVIEPADGGEYVNAPPAADRRGRSRAVLVGQPMRQTYVFFSAQEEEALLRYRDRMLAEQLKQNVVTARKRHYAKTGNLNWPKVVVRADEICVPELASSEAADWREHLVCHREGQPR